MSRNKSLVRYLVRMDEKRRGSVANSIYFIQVSPRQVSHIKLFKTRDVPVWGENAVSGEISGEWDRLKMPFHFHYIYRTIRLRIQDGIAWEKTPLNRKRRKQRDQSEIQRENDHIDRLIEGIRARGYRSQYEMGNVPPGKGWHDIGTIAIPPELIVGMDRYGRFFQLANGRHRLAIAEILGLKEIPAILTLFHGKGRDRLPEKRRLICGDQEDFRPL